LAVFAPITAPLTRALRNVFVMFTLLTMVVLRNPPSRKPPLNPRPHQGWNTSNGANGTQPIPPNPKPTPPPHPKNPTSAGDQ
jgi:hypothetical protein